MRLLDKYDPLTVAQIRASAYDGQVAYLPKQGGDYGLSTLTTTDVAAWAPLYSATPPAYLVVNYEDHSADWMSGGYSVGVGKGQYLQGEMAALGISNDVVIYLSADFHPGTALPAVLDCLRGVQSVLGAQARGVYGFVEVLDAVRGAGLADYFWLCGDQAGLSGRPWINLYQHNNNQDIVDGVTVDINDVLTPQFGQWVPGGSAPAATGGNDVFDAAAQAYLDTMRNTLAQWVTDRTTPFPFESFRNSDTGAIALAAPGHWYPVPSVAYLQLYQARMLCSAENNPAHNVVTAEFNHFRDLFMTLGTPPPIDLKALTTELAAALPALDAGAIADKVSSAVTAATVAANEAAFTRVLDHMNITLSGGATAAVTPTPTPAPTPAPAS